MIGERVIKEIEKDFEKKREEIREKYEKLYREKMEQLEKEKQTILKEAEEEANSVKNRILRQKESEVKLLVKKRILELKHRFIEQAIRDAITRVRSDPRYKEFLEENLKKYKNSPKIIISENDKDIVNNPQIETENYLGGFRVDLGKEVHDYTIDSFIELHKEEIVQMIAKMLWGKDEEMDI